MMACQSLPKPTNQEIKQDPLTVLNCPDLKPFVNETEITMGDLLLKYVEDTNQYYLCQASALNLTKQEKSNDSTAGTTKN